MTLKEKAKECFDFTSNTASKEELEENSFGIGFEDGYCAALLDISNWLEGHSEQYLKIEPTGNYWDVDQALDDLRDYLLSNEDENADKLILNQKKGIESDRDELLIKEDMVLQFL